MRVRIFRRSLGIFNPANIIRAKLSGIKSSMIFAVVPPLKHKSLVLEGHFLNKAIGIFRIMNAHFHE